MVDNTTGFIRLNMDSLEPIIATGIIHLFPIDNDHLECFYNKCHGHGGRFCATGGESNGSEKDSSEPPSGHFTDEQVKAIKAAGHKPEDYDVKGKPIPGTDSWRDAHGISKKVYETRPMRRWESSKDPFFEEAFPDPADRKFARSKIASQSTGFIMVRKAAPGAEEKFGPIAAQARPDHPIVLSQQKKFRKEQELIWAQERLEKVSSPDFTGEDVIKERAGKVTEAKKNLRLLQTQTPQEIRYNSRMNLEQAQINLKKAEKSGDEDAIGAASSEVKAAEWENKAAKNKAGLLEKDPQRAVEIAKQDLKRAEGRLEKAQADPKKALKNVRDYSKDQVETKEKQVERVPVKYVFPAGAGKASRIEVHQDKGNIKNLVDGKGKIYFIMEGNIKADAALTQVKKEDPTAAVMSVPSVTSWPIEETDWVTQTYLKDRDVILIPDADGVTNPAVVSQAKQLAGKIRTNGAKRVIIASPPLVKGKVEELEYPTGVKDERKGLDDHLGLGKGTLGDLTYNDTPPPKYDLSEYATPNAPKGTRIRSQAVRNSELVLNAISDMAGDREAGKISDKSIEKYTGLAPSSVNDSRDRLEKMQIIKVNHIFDPKLLGQYRREPIMEYDEIKRLSKKADAKMPNLDIKYIDDLNNHEVAPIIEIVNPKYVTHSGPVKNLASNYKNLKTSIPKSKTIPSGVIRLKGKKD